jgi:hypothetical protein
MQSQETLTRAFEVAGLVNQMGHLLTSFLFQLQRNPPPLGQSPHLSKVLSDSTGGHQLLTDPGNEES